MMQPDKVRELLADRKIPLVARECGLAYNTLYRFVRNEGMVSVKTLQRLTEYFEASAKKVRQ